MKIKKNTCTMKILYVHFLPYNKSVKRSCYLENITPEEIICYLNYPRLHIQCIVYIAMTCKAVQNSRSDLPVETEEVLTKYQL